MVSPWPKCGKCKNPLWKKSFPDDSFYYEPCSKCEPQNRIEETDQPVDISELIERIQNTMCETVGLRGGEVYRRIEGRISEDDLHALIKAAMAPKREYSLEDKLCQAVGFIRALRNQPEFTDQFKQHVKKVLAEIDWAQDPTDIEDGETK